jgi:hypothetical protein
MLEQTELVYLHGVERGWHRPIWPVFIQGDDPGSLTFTVAVDDPALIDPNVAPTTREDARRTYVTRLVLTVPRRAADRPEPLYLEERYEEFRAAS